MICTGFEVRPNIISCRLADGSASVTKCPNSEVNIMLTNCTPEEVTALSLQFGITVKEVAADAQEKATNKGTSS